MNPTDICSVPPALAPNAWHAFGGIWRLTARRFLNARSFLALAGALTLLGFLLTALTQNASPRFYFEWTAGFYLTFVVPILAFLSGAGAMRDEMKPQAVDYTLTRPIRRPAVVVFKFISHVACIQIGYLLALAIVIAVGAYRQIPTLWSALPWLLTAQVMAVAAFAALGALSAVLTSRYLIVGLLYAGIVEVAVGNIPTQINRLSMTRQLRTLLQPVLAPTSPNLVPEESLFSTFGFLAVFTVVMLGLAAAVFSRLELAGARPGET
jgi:ABC-2 type transport system permease protein